MAGWPEAQWVAVLISCLVALAQQAVDTLPMGDMFNYKKVQVAILQTLNLSLEVYCCQLRESEFRPDYHPCLSGQHTVYGRHVCIGYTPRS